MGNVSLVDDILHKEDGVEEEDNVDRVDDIRYRENDGHWRIMLPM